ncbi:hypothetical protein AALO_G00247510 [Alosa alosa]|uniref:Uncharacterized protein n=1 Tax=Alosa alosa TaxID=278164 RepID=A0AAV6FXI3_9TELE|nr:hypothetical protein AALO_G00247510 [Alosa alosa]
MATPSLKILAADKRLGRTCSFHTMSLQFVTVTGPWHRPGLPASTPETGTGMGPVIYSPDTQSNMGGHAHWVSPVPAHAFPVSRPPMR